MSRHPARPSALARAGVCLLAAALVTACSPGGDGDGPGVGASRPTEATSSRFPVTCIVQPVAVLTPSPDAAGPARPERAALAFVVQATGVARSLTQRTPVRAEVYLTRAKEIIAQVVLRNDGRGWVVRLVRSCGLGLFPPTPTAPQDPMGP